MNKKYSLIINVIMIIVGMVGMLLFSATNKKTAISPDKLTHIQKSEKTQPTENITVVMAAKKLTKGAHLSSGDYGLKTLTVPVNSNDTKRFSVDHPVESWLVNSDVEEGAYIPVSSLIEPGSTEYIRQSLTQGGVVYKLPIKDTDNYLFYNAHVGDGIDVYLSYGLKKVNDSSEGGDVIPTINSTGIDNKHFKILLKDKKILSMMSPQSTTERIKNISSSANKSLRDGYISIELSLGELKTLKGLDGAKLYIFPATDDVSNPDNPHSALVGDEKQWPIDNSNILSVKVREEPDPVSETAKEYRGGK